MLLIPNESMKHFLAVMMLNSSLLVTASTGDHCVSKKLIISGHENPSQSSTQSPELIEANQLNTEVVELYKNGKHDKALPLAERVLMLREKALGERHILVADALRNLAPIYFAKRKYKEAKASYRRSIAIYEKAVGADNPEMGKLLESYICLLVNVGERDEWLDVRKQLYKLDNGLDYESNHKPAISLPKPEYRPEAKSKRITGSVVMKVTIDETGKVIAVRLLCGHPLLMQGAEPAIWKARFHPTVVAGKPIQISDIAIYNFFMR